MINQHNQQVPNRSSIPCMGCHRIYSSCPLGVPIHYVPNMIESTIKTDKGVMGLLTPLKENKSKKMVLSNDYFITDGMVCSFNCMLSVGDSNPQLYRDTPTLMNLMYKKIFGKFPHQHIARAPDWKLRQTYGGPLTDDEFEKCLQTISFIDTSQLKTYVIGRVFEVYDK